MPNTNRELTDETRPPAVWATPTGICPAVFVSDLLDEVYLKPSVDRLAALQDARADAFRRWMAASPFAFSDPTSEFRTWRDIDSRIDSVITALLVFGF